MMPMPILPIPNPPPEPWHIARAQALIAGGHARNLGSFIDMWTYTRDAHNAARAVALINGELARWGAIRAQVAVLGWGIPLVENELARLTKMRTTILAARPPDPVLARAITEVPDDVFDRVPL